jgi:ADP-heptose:LPS heptosyltransferase/GT2 family glycosyltransferase
LSPPSLAAVVVHYFAPDAAAVCIRSLRSGTRAPDRIVVIDNGSEPGLGEALRATWSGVEVRSFGRNVGFAGALGPEIADLADGILVLNQDCELDPRCVELLEAALAVRRVAIACGTVLDRAGRIWARGGAIDWTGRGRNLDAGRAAEPSPAAAFEVDYAPGCATMVRAEAWREAGGMDPRFFMYGEDADLSARLRRAGWRVVCEPRAVCRHEGSSAAGGEHGPFQSYFRLRNRALFVARHSTALQAVAFVALILPALLARDLYRYARLGSMGAFGEVLLGLLRVARSAEPPDPRAIRSGRIAKTPGPARAYVYRSALRRALVRTVDSIGYALRKSRSGEPPASVARILVVKLDHLGDLILALPAIEALRAAYPHAEIDAVIAPGGEPLLASAPVTRIETLAAPWLDGGRVPWRTVRRVARRLRERRYDLAVDLRGDPVAILIARRAARFAVGIGNAGLGFLLDRVHPGPRPGLHQAEMLREVAALAGAPTAGRARPRLRPTDEERARAADLLSGLPGRPIAFHLGAGDRRKIWPPENYADVAAELAEKGHPPVVIGGAEDRAYVDRFLARLGSALDLSGKLGLGESLAVLERCAALIGNDASPGHMAAAVGTPVVIVYAPINDPARWRPAGDEVEVVTPLEGERFEAIPPARLLDAVHRLVRPESARVSS